MFTFRLWSALHRPYVAHPLYRRLKHASATRNTVASRMRDYLPEDSAWGAILLLLSIIAMAIGGWRALIFLLFLIPLALISAGTFSGLLALLKTSGLINRQTEQGKDALMGVTPLGLPGMLWALCSFAYHQDSFLKSLRETVRGVYVFGFFILIVPAFFLSLFVFLDILIASRSSGYGELPQTLVGGFGLLFLAYADLVQSILVGCLMGMLAPTYTQRRVDSSGLAVGAFLAAQFLSYALIALIDLVILPQLAAQTAIIDDTGLFLLQISVFFIVREIVLRGLWRLLVHRIEATPTELRIVTGM